MYEINALAIFVSGIVSVVIGFIWYHPKVFGTAWMRMAGITPEIAEVGKKRMPIAVGLSFLGAILVAYVINHFGIAWGVYDIVGAVELGIWTWLGFVVPVMLSLVLWDGKPFKLFLINTFNWLVTFIAIAITLVLLWAYTVFREGPSRYTGDMNISGRALLIADTCIAALALLFLWNNQDAMQTSDVSTVEIGGQMMRVDIVVSPEARARGLSGREGLADDEGMLFVFPEDGLHGFWMKDMLFPIDIVWISSSSKIVDMEVGVSPDSYPAIFTPRSKARYVLELPAGFIEEYTVRVGDSVGLPEL